MSTTDKPIRKRAGLMRDSGLRTARALAVTLESGALRDHGGNYPPGIEPSPAAPDFTSYHERALWRDVVVAAVRAGADAHAAGICAANVLISYRAAFGSEDA